jgi:hypothetical protein
MQNGSLTLERFVAELLRAKAREGGTGRFARAMSKRGFAHEIVGYDIDPNGISFNAASLISGSYRTSASHRIIGQSKLASVGLYAAT